MKRTFLTLFLVLALLCTMLPMAVISAAADEAESADGEATDEVVFDPMADDGFWSTNILFTDVSSGSWYYPALVWAVSNGITSGTTTTSFSPSQTCTRAEVVTFIWNAVGKPSVDYSGSFFTQQNTFKDVKWTDWYFEAVNWAAINGVTKGTDKTHFSPDQTCTRAEVVTFIWNAVGRPAVTVKNNPFTDVSKTAWYYKSVMWAFARGITSGVTAKTFCPDQTCTRAEVVQLLYNARAYWMEIKAENATPEP